MQLPDNISGITFEIIRITIELVELLCIIVIPYWIIIEIPGELMESIANYWS